MMVEFAPYYSLSNVFHINDNELKKYLSDIPYYLSAFLFFYI
jgi:hypothetical protein